MVRVLALVPYATGRAPGQRYRIEQWAPRLLSDGIDVTFAPFLSLSATEVLYRRGHAVTKVWAAARAYTRRWNETASREFAVHYVYREAGPLGTTWLEARAARRAPLVFDFDDAIYLPAANAPNAWAQWLKRPSKVADICRMARHVIVGNETLALFARQYSSNVTVLPSTIDTDRYVVVEQARNARPILGWTGSLTTAPHLQQLAPALAELRRSFDFQLRVIGARVEMPGLDVECLPWSAEREVDDLRPIDVGLMPLPDDEWSKGKCGMKALQYMALAIPPVVAPVGANTEIVTDGVTGLHARSHREWVDRLGLLLSDDRLRQRLGAAARRRVEEGYSARVQAPRLARIIRDAAGAH